MKKVLFILSATILLATGCNTKSNVQQSEPVQSASSVNSSQPSAENVQNAGPPIYNGRPIYVGQLQISDNPAKGNLMLLAKPDVRMGGGDIQKDTTFYIKTQRDYNSLIGKKVLVGFLADENNHVNSFNVIDIVEDTGQSSFPN